MNDKPKECPVCKKRFTRYDFKPRLGPNQWFLRIYCSRKCYFKAKRETKNAR